MFGAWIIRSLLIAPYYIPSQSMMPALHSRDFIITWRWPYAVSWRSFIASGSTDPWSQGKVPARGDMVVFASPFDRNVNFVKRVIGLPGDRVALVDGIVVLNGRPLIRQHLSDFDIPIGLADSCLRVPQVVNQYATSNGQPVCRFSRELETLPDGRSYAVLDIARAYSDTMAEVTVPKGHLFMLGDNRDNSVDSRYGADAGGVGMVPVSLVLGEVITLFGVSSNDSRRYMGFRKPDAAF